MSARSSNVALAAGACLVGIGLGGAYQATQPASTIPAAVRAACDKYFGAGAGVMPEEKTWDGVKVYVCSGSSKDGAQSWLTLSPNGDMQEISKSVQFKDLPKTLQDKLNAKFPNAKGFEDILSAQINAYSLYVVKEDGKREQVSLFAAGNKWDPSTFKHEWKKEQKSEQKQEKKEESKKPEAPKKP